MKSLILPVFAVALIAGACSSSEGGTGTTQVPSTTTVASTTGPTTTSSTLPLTTTTTVAPTTTTTVAEVEASVVVEFEVEEGWQYRVTVMPVGTDPSASPGNCVEVAPPGQTNLVFTLLLESLIDDRDAPIPSLTSASNILDDGTVAESVAPFSDELDELDHYRPDEEIMPNAPDTMCRSAGSLYDNAGDIAAGQVREHTLTIGTANEDSVENVLVGIRFFTYFGGWVETIFTLEPDSGTITTGSIDDE